MNDPQISFEFSQNLTSIQRSLYGYILSLLPHRSDAEDVLQETNLILCKKATEFDPKGHFQGWAFKIARFQVMRHITKNKRSRLHFSNDIIDSIPADDFDSEKVQLVQKALLKCYDLLPTYAYYRKTKISRGIKSKGHIHPSAKTFGINFSYFTSYQTES